MLHDAHGRSIGYLRLSLTKACAMRCIYCRPAFLSPPRGEAMLSVDEIDRLVRHLVDHHGLYRVRLTGGDPTSRPELTRIIERIAAVDGIKDLAMTTNGLTLSRRAPEYAAAGLNRINVSLDTLDRDRFESLTGVDGLERVLAGIDAAKAAGLHPIKINAVIIRGQNERDLLDLVRFGADNDLTIRFIELMPMGPLADRWNERYVSERRMREHLDPHVAHWEPIAQGHDAARQYQVELIDGRRATVGFITPMSCNFCAACHRIRIAADGEFFPCLMDEPRGTLLPAIRPWDADRLDELLAQGLHDKRAEHPHDGFVTMTHIGG
jgi:cyclic pyranopterin phosphate synthase